MLLITLKSTISDAQNVEDYSSILKDPDFRGGDFSGQFGGHVEDGRHPASLPLSQLKEIPSTTEFPDPKKRSSFKESSYSSVVASRHANGQTKKLGYYDQYSNINGHAKEQSGLLVGDGTINPKTAQSKTTHQDLVGMSILTSDDEGNHQLSSIASTEFPEEIGPRDFSDEGELTWNPFHPHPFHPYDPFDPHHHYYPDPHPTPPPHTTKNPYIRSKNKESKGLEEDMINDEDVPCPFADRQISEDRDWKPFPMDSFQEVEDELETVLDDEEEEEDYSSKCGDPVDCIGLTPNHLLQIMTSAPNLQDFLPQTIRDQFYNCVSPVAGDDLNSLMVPSSDPQQPLIPDFESYSGKNTKKGDCSVKYSVTKDHDRVIAYLPIYESDLDLARQLSCDDGSPFTLNKDSAADFVKVHPHLNALLKNLQASPVKIRIQISQPED